MRPEGSFIAERVAARHCAELLGTGLDPAALSAALALAGERLSRSLPAALARLAGGEAPKITMAPPRECTPATIAAEAARLVSWSLLGAGPVATAAPLLLAIDAAPVLRLVDRAFGGKGQAPDPLPDTFPLSADLLVRQLEGLIGTALWQAAGAPPGMEIAALRRDTSFAQLAPFDPETRIFQLLAMVQEPGANPWTMTINLSFATLAALLGPLGRTVRKATGSAAPVDPLAGACGDIPLGLRAVIVDMPIAFSRLADLRPGDVLPVSVARAVPLRLGDQVIATGTVGELEDRIAIRLGEAPGQR